MMSNLNITKFHSKYYAYELTCSGRNVGDGMNFNNGQNERVLVIRHKLVCLIEEKFHKRMWEVE